MKRQNQIYEEGPGWIDIGNSIYEIKDASQNYIQNYNINNFEELINLTETDFSGLLIDEALFTHKTKIRLWGYFWGEWITKNKFDRYYHQIKFRSIYNIYKPTLEWLTKNLSAEYFIKYADERKWNYIITK